MTVHEYINAIRSATTAGEVLNLWADAAKQKNLSLNDIITVHRSCGAIVHNALMEVVVESGEEIPPLKTTM